MKTIFMILLMCFAGFLGAEEGERTPGDWDGEPEQGAQGVQGNQGEQGEVGDECEEDPAECEDGGPVPGSDPS